MNDNADIDRVLRLAAEFNEALDQFGSYGEEMVCLVAVMAIGGQCCDAARALALLRAGGWSAPMWLVSVRYSVVRLPGAVLHCNMSG